MEYQQAAPGTPLPFEGVENFRELGGYQTSDGRRVKHGLFYRCGALGDIKLPQDQALLHSLGVRVICDFRSAQERELLPDLELPGAVYYGNSAMRGEDGGEINFDPRALTNLTIPEMKATISEVAGYYTGMPHNNPAYRTMFAEIMEGHLPLLFHCSAGKDRTGVAAALILSALGVPRETVIQDYMITNTCRPRATQRLIRRYRERFPDDPELEPLVKVITGVRRPFIEAALDSIAARYPSFEAYLQDQYQIGPAQLTRLRDACLE